MIRPGEPTGGGKTERSQVQGKSRRWERARSRSTARGPLDGGRGTTRPLPPPATRAELPTDHRTLPLLSHAFHETLDRGLADLGIALSGGARAAIEAHARLLIAWSGAINLTAHRTDVAIALEHVVDSLAALPLLSGRPRLLDLGSGAGYPGLPIAVALPCRQAALVDSIGKKARFLTVSAGAATSELEAAGERAPVITSLAERVEDLCQRPDQRETWDVVTARAVAPLHELIELGFPLLRIGGRLVCWKRDDGSGALGEEVTVARRSLAVAGDGRMTIDPVPARGLEDHRLIVIVKRRATPDALPRASAERRRPLLP